ncbi:Histidinol dehydrogenase [Anatilimnocola aggregata]|uniref:Histidinol dehydrogenase n=1 Tax=Anatilimnocola aggregata TaxID=2528021 RepID=A0A517YJD9_9BACT|nr:histidinol dehydrogenase [Anatilimnocola aggregata]QDU30343.1 Histidinol dehydrogenase [Anatilimnocola aggregata]
MTTPLQIQRIDARSENVTAALDVLRAKLSPSGNVVSEAGKRRTLEVFGEPLTPVQVVERICSDVKQQGLPAVLEYSRKLDRAELTAETIRVSAAELAAAHSAADPRLLAAVRRVRANILGFQQAILHQDKELQRPGVLLAQRYVPLNRVGVCVPGGAAAYPSTVLMAAVPAQAAGVKEVAVVSPPTAFGANNPVVLATCHEIGIREVYRIGGAQGIAALAYGVAGLPKVDKIVGPGNLFVALAKRHVYGEVDIDSIAGPSEVVVLADDTTRADFTAADLLAQAEHAPGASILITWSERLLEATAAELQKQVQQLTRCQLALDSLRDFGCLILVRDAEEACRLTDMIAPEHLHIATDNAAELLKKIRNSGATFLGNYSPVALGDYAAGPSHVLPTGGTARWASGLSANHFLRSSSVIQYDQSALKDLSADIEYLAQVEGLTAHEQSVAMRTR